MDPLTAHVGGLPVEELAPFAGGAGLLAARELWLRVRRRVRRGATDRDGG
jgi:hypothetical protein